MNSILFYRTTDGIAGIDLPQPGTLIEVKQVGMALPDKPGGRNESPQEQLGGHLHADGLSSQLPLAAGRARTLVLHPIAGDPMRGARARPGPAVLGNTGYYFLASSA